MNVRLTRSVDARSGPECGISLLFLKKRMFSVASVFVRWLSSLPVFEYSHERKQKKKVRQASSEHTRLIGSFVILLGCTFREVPRLGGLSVVW